MAAVQSAICGTVARWQHRRGGGGGRGCGAPATSDSESTRDAENACVFSEQGRSSGFCVHAAGAECRHPARVAPALLAPALPVGEGAHPSGSAVTGVGIAHCACQK